MSCIRNCIGLAVLLTGYFLRAAEDPVILDYHFVGTSRLTTGVGGEQSKFRKIADLSATQAVRDPALLALALIPGQLFNLGQTNDYTAGQALRPIIEDLVQAESAGRWTGAAASNSVLVIGAKVAADRLPIWSSALEAALQHWKVAAKGGSPSKHEWTLSGRGKGKHVRLSHTNGWLTLLLDNGTAKTGRSMSTRLGRPDLAKDDLLKMTFDWPRMAGWMSQVPLKPASLEIAMTRRGSGVRTTAKALYPAALGWTPVKWMIPTNVVKDPLVSFAAARGLAAVMKPIPALAGLGINPLTNQVFLWAQGSAPFQSFAAIPMDRASNGIPKLYPKLAAKVNPLLSKNDLGELQLDTNRYQIVWAGLQILYPYLRSLEGAPGDFLVAGMFPRVITTNTAPQELFQRVRSSTNLLYYGWEITEPRLSHWEVVSGMPFWEALALSGSAASRPSDALFGRWLREISPQLGNCVTEVRVTGPRQVDVLRQSDIGLAAVELVQLARWLAVAPVASTNHSVPVRSSR